MFKVNESFRLKSGDFATNEKDGNNGIFLIPYESDLLQCIASDGEGWEHVSVCVKTKNRDRYAIPNWEQMCIIKDIFWSEDDTVIQFHPKKSEYINNHNYVLHLWKQVGSEFPIPNSILVGIK